MESQKVLTSQKIESGWAKWSQNLIFVTRWQSQYDNIRHLVEYCTVLIILCGGVRVIWPINMALSNSRLSKSSIIGNSGNARPRPERMKGDVRSVALVISFTFRPKAVRARSSEAEEIRKLWVAARAVFPFGFSVQWILLLTFMIWRHCTIYLLSQYPHFKHKYLTSSHTNTYYNSTPQPQPQISCKSKVKELFRSYGRHGSGSRCPIVGRYSHGLTVTNFQIEFQ